MTESRGRRILENLPGPLRRLLKGLRGGLGSIVDRVRALRTVGPTALTAPSLNLAREFTAVRAGLGEFERNAGSQPNVDYVLRRNIHRLEKGMISRPRRDVFAKGYIEETVDHFLERAANTDRIEDGSELAWSRDVLEEYFGIVGSAPEIDRARVLYETARPSDKPPQEPTLSPYVRELDSGSPVDYEALRDLSVRRRSVRWFEERPVPRDLIDAAIAVAAQSPSACNRQPFEFWVYDAPDDVRRVAAVPGGTVGFAENIPVIVALIGRLDAFFSQRDRHVIYIDGSLAAMSFMLALETLGLSSCPINTPGEEWMERELAEQLALEPYERPIMLIALGYPDPTGMVPRSQKRSLDALRRYNP